MRSWISFYTGRPHSMSKPDFDIPLPDDPFLVHLTRLIPVMTETTERIYQSKPLSSMSYYRSAMAIYQDLKAVAASVHKEFGIELESSRNMSSHGPRETIMVTRMSSMVSTPLHNNYRSPTVSLQPYQNDPISAICITQGQVEIQKINGKCYMAHFIAHGKHYSSIDYSAKRPSMAR